MALYHNRKYMEIYSTYIIYLIMHSNIYSNNTRSIWTTTLPTISISEKSQFFGSYQSQLHKQQHPDHLQHIKPRPGAIVKLSHRRKSPRTNHMLMQLLNDPIGGLRPSATWRNEMPRRSALVGHWAFSLDVLCWENLGVFVDGINSSPIPHHLPLKKKMQLDHFLHTGFHTNVRSFGWRHLFVSSLSPEKWVDVRVILTPSSLKSFTVSTESRHFNV